MYEYTYLLHTRLAAAASSFLKSFVLRPRCALRAGVTSKERRVTMRACRMKGHRGSGRGRGGWSRVGGGWEADGSGSVPSAQQKGDSRWPQAPPSQRQPHPTPHINSIQGDALSSRQRDTFLTTSEPPPPPPPSLPPPPLRQSPNHTMVGMPNQSSGYLQSYIKVKGRAYRCPAPPPHPPLRKKWDLDREMCYSK